MHRLVKMHSQEMVDKMVSFPFENNIETMDRLAKMHGQKLLTQRLDFKIWKN